MNISKQGIAPAWAVYLLQHSPGNRSIAKNRVQDFCRMIRAGQWACSQDAIVIMQDAMQSSPPRLLNGHHRLTACVETGVTIEVLLMRVQPDEVTEAFLLAMDTGRSRSLHDQTACLAATTGGRTISKAAAACVAAAIAGATPRQGTIDRARVLRAYDRRANFVSRLANTTNGVAHSVAVVSCLLRAVISGAIGESEALAFQSALSSPGQITDITRFSGALALLTALTNCRGTIRGGSNGIRHRYLLAASAIKAYAEHRQVTRCMPLQSCPFPCPELAEVAQ